MAALRSRDVILQHYCIVTVLVHAWPCTPGHTSASQSRRTSQPAAPAETFLAMALWRNTAVAVLLVSPWSYRSANNTSAGCNTTCQSSTAPTFSTHQHHQDTPEEQTSPGAVPVHPSPNHCSRGGKAVQHHDWVIGPIKQATEPCCKTHRANWHSHISFNVNEAPCCTQACGCVHCKYHYS